MVCSRGGQPPAGQALLLSQRRGMDRELRPSPWCRLKPTQWESLAQLERAQSGFSRGQVFLWAFILLLPSRHVLLAPAGTVPRSRCRLARGSWRCCDRRTLAPGHGKGACSWCGRSLYSAASPLDRKLLFLRASCPRCILSESSFQSFKSRGCEVPGEQPRQPLSASHASAAARAVPGRAAPSSRARLHSRPGVGGSGRASLALQG